MHIVFDGGGGGFGFDFVVVLGGGAFDCNAGCGCRLLSFLRRYATHLYIILESEVKGS